MKKFIAVLFAALMVMSVSSGALAQTGATIQKQHDTQQKGTQNQSEAAERKWIEVEKTYPKSGSDNIPSYLNYDDGKGWMGQLILNPDRTVCGGTHGTTCIVVYEGFVYYQY